MKDDDDEKYIPHLEGQNKSLNREVKKFKRKLLEKSKDLESLRNKSIDLEKVVAIIQKCWGQVNITNSS